MNSSLKLSYTTNNYNSNVDSVTVPGMSDLYAYNTGFELDKPNLELDNVNIESNKNSLNSKIKEILATSADVLTEVACPLIDTIQSAAEGIGYLVLTDCVIPFYDKVGNLDMGELHLNVDGFNSDEGVSNDSVDISLDTSHFLEESEKLKELLIEYSKNDDTSISDFIKKKGRKF